MAASDHPRLARARRFGLEIGGAALALALFFAWRGTHPSLRPALVVTAVPLLAAALVRPALLAPMATAWLALGERIAAVTTPVFLTLIYLLVVTPFGLLRRRLFGSPILRDPAAPTYWVRRPPSTPEARRSAMEHQF